MCSAIDLRTSALGYAFFQEAEMLYRSECMSDLLPNSSALAIFSMVCTLRCREDLAMEAQQLSHQMGERMKLFGVIDEESSRAQFRSMPSHMKIASSQAAWGLYNWLRCALGYTPAVSRLRLLIHAVCVPFSTRAGSSGILQSCQFPVVIMGTDAKWRQASTGPYILFLIGWGAPFQHYAHSGFSCRR